VDTFIVPKDLDPAYYTDRTYYLVPDGPVGQKPYTVLCQAMAEEGRQAIAQVVMHSKEHLVLLRSVEGLLAMTVLHYDPEVAKPSAFAEEAPPVEGTRSQSPGLRGRPLQSGRGAGRR
jgi:non-homologous end joining protein Ku